TLKANMGGDQYFSAPDRSIGSVSCAIKRDPNHFSIQMIFSHAGNDVGVMMLHRNMLEVFALQRPLRREIIGMQIVRDDSRLHFQYPLKMRNRFHEEVITFRILQIADVLTKKRFRSPEDANRIFQLGTNG